MASYDQARALLKTSVSRKTLYTLNIDGAGLSRAQKDYIRLFATKVSVPSISIDQVSSIGQEHMGIQRNTASGVSFGGNQLIIQMLENSDFTAYDTIRDLFNRSGINLNPLGKNDGRTQRMKYYDDYIFDITLTKLEFPDGQNVFNKSKLPETNDLDHGYKIVSRYKFEKCHVQNITELQFDSAARDQQLDFGVTFSFESYYHNNTKTMDIEYRND